MENEKEHIDSLLSEVSFYKNTKECKRLFTFIAKCTTLGAYNSMLVYNQNPDATIVMSKTKWEQRLNKGIKENAKPLVTLIPYGPIEWCYDYKDTYDLQGKLIKDENELVAIYNSMFRPPEEICPKYLNNVMEALPYYGVHVETDLKAAPTYGGYIQQNSNFRITITYKKRTVNRKSSFLICINQRATPSEQLMTFIHEMAHLLLQHVPAPVDFRKPWDVRLKYDDFYSVLGVPPTNLDTKETEAEITKELVCNRLGIDNHMNAINYLACYNSFLDKDKFNVDLIITAVSEIEKIVTGGVKPNECLLAKQIPNLFE